MACVMTVLHMDMSSDWRPGYRYVYLPFCSPLLGEYNANRVVKCRLHYSKIESLVRMTELYLRRCDLGGARTKKSDDLVSKFSYDQQGGKKKA